MNCDHYDVLLFFFCLIIIINSLNVYFNNIIYIDVKRSSLISRNHLNQIHYTPSFFLFNIIGLICYHVTFVYLSGLHLYNLIWKE